MNLNICISAKDAGIPQAQVDDIWLPCMVQSPKGCRILDPWRFLSCVAWASTGSSLLDVCGKGTSCRDFSPQGLEQLCVPSWHIVHSSYGYLILLSLSRQGGWLFGKDEPRVSCVQANSRGYNKKCHVIQLAYCPKSTAYAHMWYSK